MTDAVEIFLGDLKCQLQRFEPKAGDFFVLTFPDEVPLEVARRLKAQWDEACPYKCAVITGGIRVEMAKGEELKR